MSFLLTIADDPSLRQSSLVIFALFLVGWVFDRRTARRELAALDDLENDRGTEK